MRPLVITLSVLVVLGAGYVAAQRLADWGAGLTPGEDETVVAEPGLPITIEIAPGASARSIGRQLAAAGVVRNADAFELAVRAADAAGSLKSGVYPLETGMTAEAVLAILIEGPAAETFWVTIPEGLRIQEVLDRLSSVSGVSRTSLEEALLDGSVTSRWLTRPAATLAEWEGLLFPDTYEFSTSVGPVPMLQLLADTMHARANAVVEDYAYDLIIVASLIEAEARLDDDRANIASVVFNRLEIDMPLQVDATVLYAMGVRGVALTLDDLDVESPYNTYLYGGLPPTPIGAPGLASLEAAAAPAETDYLYYVLTSTEGAHSFTASYDEFLAFKNQAKQDGVLP